MTARRVAPVAGGWWADCECCETFHDGPHPAEDTAVQADGRHDDIHHHALPTAAVHPDTTSTAPTTGLGARAGRR